MPDLGTLGTEELLIVVFLLGILLAMTLLVVVAAAMLFVWAPHWLEQQHRRWHAARVRATEGRE
jgi:high-affinity Fe2+/Pb2+ permease